MWAQPSARRFQSDPMRPQVWAQAQCWVWLVVLGAAIAVLAQSHPADIARSLARSLACLLVHSCTRPFHTLISHLLVSNAASSSLCIHSITPIPSHTHTPMHAHARTACTRARMRGMHACTHAHIHARTHACTHAYPFAHALTHARMHAGTGNHTLVQRRAAIRVWLQRAARIEHSQCRPVVSEQCNSQCKPPERNSVQLVKQSVQQTSVTGQCSSQCNGSEQ